MTLRRARSEDAEAAGRICYDAFTKINADHGFPPDLPNAETAIGWLNVVFAHSGFYAVVAEEDGRLVGSNVLDERSQIAGIGPITVAPAEQNRAVGRQLMLHVMTVGLYNEPRGAYLASILY